MGRGSIALVWLIILVGIGAAYGMGVADGRKRAEGAAAAREQVYQYRLGEACRMLLKYSGDAERARESATTARPEANSPDREPLSRARRPARTPSADAGPLRSALAADGS